MMAIANEEQAQGWQNFAAWSAAGAIVYILIMGAAMALLHQDPLEPILQPTKVTAELGAALLVAVAVAGFTNRKRPLGFRTIRNFLIQNAIAIIAFLLVIWGFSALASTGAVGVSEWVAAVTGATLIVIACLGMLATASVHAGVDLVDDEMAAGDMRERGRLILCSLAWMVACGLLLITLSLAAPGGVLSPTTALVVALFLVAILTVLTIAAWRLSDELGRTLSHETGNMAFYLIVVLGSGWAMLAHLGFVAAPAPLDWVTLFTILLFAASFIVLGRRKLLTR